MGEDENLDIELKVSDAATIDVTLDVRECVLTISAASSTKVNGTFDYIETKVSDAAKLQLQGEAEMAKYQSLDASSIEASGFIAQEVFINAKGASFLSFYVAEYIAEFHTSGAPIVTINSPKKIRAGSRRDL